MFFPKLQNGFRWSLPWLYARPNYFMIITPFGTQHIDYPPIYVLPVFAILLIVTVAFFYFLVCRPHGGLCCCCRKCLSYCARRCYCWDLNGRIKVLIITDKLAGAILGVGQFSRPGRLPTLICCGKFDTARKPDDSVPRAREC